jgi:hypothetical protein
MVQQKLSWKFPDKDFTLLRLELVFLAIIAAIVFIFAYYDFDQRWYLAILFTVIFISLYFFISAIVQKIRLVKEVYTLTPSHLEIHRQHRFGSVKHKVHFKDIKQHKLDHTFLGGYILTHKGKKHSLFFNTKKEVQRFESFMKRHGKKK